MKGLFGGIGFAIVAIGMIVAPAGASAALTFSSVPSATEARIGDTVEVAMTAGNTGPDTERFTVAVNEIKYGGEKSVPNPILSVSSTHGGCSPADGWELLCHLEVPAGVEARIGLTFQVNESLFVQAGVREFDGGLDPVENTTVWANYPPRFLDSSKKIKFNGLPDGCVDSDLTAEVSAKGAKKIAAWLVGPKDEWGGRAWGDPPKVNQKLAAKQGSKLKLNVPLERQVPGFYNLQVTATYEKGPKRRAKINLQRCGDPIAAAGY
jgi:hypothetical protein